MELEQCYEKIASPYFDRMMDLLSAPVITIPDLESIWNEAVGLEDSDNALTNEVLVEEVGYLISDLGEAVDEVFQLSQRTEMETRQLRSRLVEDSGDEDKDSLPTAVLVCEVGLLVERLTDALFRSARLSREAEREMIRLQSRYDQEGDTRKPRRVIR